MKSSRAGTPSSSCSATSSCPAAAPAWWMGVLPRVPEEDAGEKEADVDEAGIKAKLTAELLAGIAVLCCGPGFGSEAKAEVGAEASKQAEHEAKIASEYSAMRRTSRRAEAEAARDQDRVRVFRHASDRTKSRGRGLESGPARSHPRVRELGHSLSGWVCWEGGSPLSLQSPSIFRPDEFIASSSASVQLSASARTHRWSVSGI